MELRVTQNSIGRYNLCSTEKSLAFSMAIFDEGKIYEENGVKARIEFRGSEDEAGDFDNPFDNLDYVFEKCFEHANHIISSTDYKAQTMLFARTYQKHYDELNENLIKENRERIEKKIASLKKELEKKFAIYDLTETVNGCLNKEIQGYEKYLKNDMKELEQTVPGTGKYTKTKEWIDKWQKYIDYYKNQLLEAE